MKSSIERNTKRSKPTLRGWRRSLQFMAICGVLALFGAGIVTASGLIDPIPLHSWTALRTYIVDRVQPRWTALQRVVWPVPLIVQADPTAGEHPTLVDLWEGNAAFVVDVPVTGLPMGESDTILLRDGRLWSYVHASDRSAGVRDSCGDPVPFPGCAVIYQSQEEGTAFALRAATCLTACNQCPCALDDNHIDQQQYPRVAFDGKLLHMVYEYRGMVMHRTSEDGLTWEAPNFVPATGFWARDFQTCPAGAAVGTHPYTDPVAECLMGGPPGIYVEGDALYIFVGMGQNPGAMGCYRGRIDEPIAQLDRCTANPLFVGAATYGDAPIDATANPHFDFRTISSAEVQRVGDRYYMLYEGVRGPGPDDPGDTQFGLGLARSLTPQVDGPWETYPVNPILVDLPANIGIGHADLVVLGGVTYLYTSLDGTTRSRLVLRWR